ncbi:MAG: S-layer homology domain-containing protein [Oscillibacter sp.]|nr:S-layer homology domain-containing protein [Oscillibacter sp.]
MEKAPEQVIEALRKLLAEAKKLAASSSIKNEGLDACIRKAEALLASGDVSAEAAVKLSAELGALIKGGFAEAPEQPSGGKAAPAPAARTAEPKSAKAPEAPKGKTVEFSDVDPNAYYYDAVQWAVSKGITSGTTETTFSPDKTCTRAQTITFLWRAAGSPAPKGGENPFADVKEESHYYNAVLWAAERGIVSGSAFKPDDAVTRAQAATFLFRNAGSPAVKGGASFTDVPADAYYAQAVAWAAEKGVTPGTKDNTFRPDAACTRGQIVTFLYRAQK